ncbi:hypothetical protein K431DRAFT_350651 [Polychaeton citri CBS 116435]|uniref:Uncharacterized protein n=1 Tax=Polychaeton citri CBS 116435 TaxID=1314669 RepID=A0A9P4PY81_9PEZI|nr:hypothetical protein K431DRAFT_350651 [Polychaeton citri CBS 116435]
MGAALVAAVALAVGHHVFYTRLNGTKTPSDGYSLGGTRISKQQVNVALGTSLSFLVKVCLTIALSAAYIQAFWKAMSHRAIRLSHLDVTFSAMSNAFSLCHLGAWFKFPLLLYLALTAWLIPLASVVTPATLTVKVAQLQPVPSSLQQVPNLDFRSLNFAASMAARESSDLREFFYNGPQFELERVAVAVAAQGAILSITPPKPNATWSLTFPGPRINCQRLANDTSNDIMEILRESSAYINCNNAFGYLAWTPTNGSVAPSTATLASQGLGPIDNNASQPAALYVALFPYIEDYQGKDPNRTEQDASAELSERKVHVGGHGPMVVPTSQKGCNAPAAAPDMLKCELWNSTYNVTFDYVNGEQKVALQLEDIAPVSALASLQANNPEYLEVYSQNIPDCQLDTPRNVSGSRCAYNPAAVKNIAYQSTMDAFGRLIVGQIGFDHDMSEVKGGSALNLNTTIVSTSLFDAPEMGFLRSWVQGLQYSQGLGQLQSAVAKSGDSDVTYLASNDSTTSQVSLAAAMEQMFQNITISLMSSPYLSANYSAPSAPLLTNVTFTTYHNVYDYAAQKLWLAYGLAIGATAIGIIIGTVALVQNGLAYSNNFSTVLRATKCADISVPINNADLDGRDPLPGYLSKAKIEMPGASGLSHSEQSTGLIQDLKGSGTTVTVDAVESSV